MRVNHLLGKQWCKHNKMHRAWWPPAIYSLSANVIWIYCSLATKLNGVTLFFFVRWTCIRLSSMDKTKIRFFYNSSLWVRKGSSEVWIASCRFSTSCEVTKAILCHHTHKKPSEPLTISVVHRWSCGLL